jgi:hypothetical protein
VLQYDCGSDFYELNSWILVSVAKCSNILQDIAKTKMANKFQCCTRIQDLCCLLGALLPGEPSQVGHICCSSTEVAKTRKFQCCTKIQDKCCLLGAMLPREPSQVGRIYCTAAQGARQVGPISCRTVQVAKTRMANKLQGYPRNQDKCCLLVAVLPKYPRQEWPISFSAEGAKSRCNAA